MAKFEKRFATIRYPSEAKFAVVHAAVDKGTILIRSAAGGTLTDERALPESPVYNLNNAACGRNTIIPLGATLGVPEVVAVTAVNDSDTSGKLAVEVGVSHLPVPNQNPFSAEVPLEANGGSAFVQLVFHKLD